LEKSVSKKATKTNFGPIPWYQVWWLSVTRPTLDMYNELIARAEHPIRTAYLWIGIVGVITGLLRLLAYLMVHFTDPAMTHLPLALFLRPWPVVVLIIGMFTAIAGVTHLSAKALRGSGRFADVLYLKAAHSTPILLTTLVLAFIVPLSIQTWVVLPLTLYQIALNLPTVRVSHRFGVAKGIIAGIVIPVLVLAALGAAVYYSGYRLELTE
jgi:hypothetical protein